MQDTQQLLKILEKNKSVQFILEHAAELAMPDWYLGAGGIAHTVWNVLHGFEPVFTPQWAYNYPSKYKDELEPVQAYFADQERTQPMLIVYKFKNENI